MRTVLAALFGIVAALVLELGGAHAQVNPVYRQDPVTGNATQQQLITVPSGQSITLQSGATLTCLAGATCPGGGSSTLLIPNGTLAAPGLAFASETGTGWRRIAAGKIGFGIAGAEYGYIDTNGNITHGLRSGRFVTGTGNFAGGPDTLRSATSANDNLTLLSNAGFALTTGSGNLFGGLNAGASATTAAKVVAWGWNAGASLTTTAGPTDFYASVLVGSQAGRWLGANDGNGGNACGGDGTCGSQNGSSTGVLAYRLTAWGAGALLNAKISTEDTAIGHEAMKLTTGGGSNAAIARAALANCIDCTFSFGGGHAAGYNFIHGGSNTWGGNEAGGNPLVPNTQTGTGNAGWGEQAGPLGSFNFTLALGTGATVAASSMTTVGSSQVATMVSGRLSWGVTTSSVANAAGVTYTVDQYLGGLIVRSGAVAVSDTTPTAAQVVAGLPDCEANSTSAYLEIQNGNTGPLTIVAADASVTLAGTTSVTNGFTRRFVITPTNCGSGTEAVTMRGISMAAN